MQCALRAHKQQKQKQQMRQPMGSKLDGQFFVQHYLMRAYVPHHQQAANERNMLVGCF
jgi:hypothetical protein